MQVLQNPTLEWNGQPPLAGMPVVIEQPRAWRYVHQPVDGGLLATSLHNDSGFRLEGGSRAYHAGYSQSVALVKGGRYTMKMVFTPEIYASPFFDPHSVRVYLQCGDQSSDDHWLKMSDHHQTQTITFGFTAQAGGVMPVVVWVNNKWPIENMVVTVHLVEMVMAEAPEPEEPPHPPPPDDEELPGDPVKLAVMYIQYDAQIAALEGQIAVLRGKQREIVAKALAAG